MSEYTSAGEAMHGHDWRPTNRYLKKPTAKDIAKKIFNIAITIGLLILAGYLVAIAL